MRANRVVGVGMFSLVCALWAPGSAVAQEPAAPVPPAPPPTVIAVSGHLRTPLGEPRQGTVVLQLSLYGRQDDTTPMWIEDQTVTLDAVGGYVVHFGATRDEGLPSYLFAGALARWVGVAVAGEPEQPRTAVLSAPYAANAAAAETLGGKTASDFVLSENLRAILRGWGLLGSTSGETSATKSAATTQSLSDWSGPSTPNALVKWLDNVGTPGDSAVYETGGRVGLGTANPVGKLDISMNGGIGPFLGMGDTQAGGVEYRLYNGGVAPGTFGVYDATHGLYRFVISSLGHVGIGTAAPGGKVDVAAHGGFWYFMGLTDTQPGGVTYRLYNGGAAPGTFGVYDATNLLYRLVIDSGGRVGIGTTTPDTRLTVRSAADADTEPFKIRNASNIEKLAVKLGATGAPQLNFENNGTKVRIDAAGDSYFGGGRVGLGTTTPSEQLHVAGNVKVTGNITADGTVTSTYQDVAEWVTAAEAPTAATVVSADRRLANHVRQSTRAYDTAVLGVVSSQPGVLLGRPGEGKVAVAQSGRVKVKADARYGAIRPGDLLVTSPAPGCAMRSRPTRAGIHRPGTIIGKALEALPAGRGEILVLLTLQ